jgi:REP element-mobilizing transposase RayT
MDEARLLYHIVLTIHNSRISRRMLKYKVYKKPAKYLSLKQEIMLTHMFKATILELKLKCYAYNVCRDHVHLVIQCQADDLTETTRKLKGKTAYLYNQATGNSGPFG